MAGPHAYLAPANFDQESKAILICPPRVSTSALVRKSPGSAGPLSESHMHRFALTTATEVEGPSEARDDRALTALEAAGRFARTVKPPVFEAGPVAFRESN